MSISLLHGISIDLLAVGTATASSRTNPQQTVFLPTSASSPPNDHMKVISSSYLNEEKEKSKRQLNLIVHNLKEFSLELHIRRMT